MTERPDNPASWLTCLSIDHADLEVRNPATDEAIADAEAQVGPLPPALRELYAVSNGLTCRSFRLFPLYDKTNPKKTWDSLQRANLSDSAEALSGDAELLKRFLVVADIGNGFAMVDRTDGSVWFEEEHTDDVQQTDLAVRELIEVMVREAE